MRWWIYNLVQWPLHTYYLLLIFNTYTSPTRPTCIIRFFVFIGSLLRPIDPSSVAFCGCSTFMSHSLPTFSIGAVLRPPGLLPHPPLASLCRSSLRSAPHACRRCRYHVFYPPRCRQFATLRSLLASEFLPSWVPLRLCSPASSSLHVHHISAYSGSWYLFLDVHFARGRGARSPPLPGSCFP